MKSEYYFWLPKYLFTFSIFMMMVIKKIFFSIFSWKKNFFIFNKKLKKTVINIQTQKIEQRWSSVVCLSVCSLHHHYLPFFCSFVCLTFFHFSNCFILQMSQPSLYTNDDDDDDFFFSTINWQLVVEISEKKRRLRSSSSCLSERWKKKFPINDLNVELQCLWHIHVTYTYTELLQNWN